MLLGSDNVFVSDWQVVSLSLTIFAFQTKVSTLHFNCEVKVLKKFLKREEG